MRPVLERIPIQLTSFDAWAKAQDWTQGVGGPSGGSETPNRFLVRRIQLVQTRSEQQGSNNTGRAGWYGTNSAKHHYNAVGGYSNKTSQDGKSTKHF